MCWLCSNYELVMTRAQKDLREKAKRLDDFQCISAKEQKVISSPYTEAKQWTMCAGIALWRKMKWRCTGHSNFQKFIPPVARRLHYSCNKGRLRDTRASHISFFFLCLIYFINSLFYTVAAIPRIQFLYVCMCVCDPKRERYYTCVKPSSVEIPFK